MRAVVTEAKYVGVEAAAEARRTSKQQLRHTVQRIEEALFGDPGRLDRDLWLSRIADLLLDGTTRWGSPMRSKLCATVSAKAPPRSICVVLPIFISGLTETGGTGEQEPIADVPHGLQGIFAREDLRNLLKAYEARAPLAGVRSRSANSIPGKTPNSVAQRRGSTGPTGHRRPWRRMARRRPRADKSSDPAEDAKASYRETACHQT